MHSFSIISTNRIVNVKKYSFTFLKNNIHTFIGNVTNFASISEGNFKSCWARDILRFEGKHYRQYIKWTISGFITWRVRWAKTGKQQIEKWQSFSSWYNTFTWTRCIFDQKKITRLLTWRMHAAEAGASFLYSKKQLLQGITAHNSNARCYENEIIYKRRTHIQNQIFTKV